MSSPKSAASDGPLDAVGEEAGPGPAAASRAVGGTHRLDALDGLRALFLVVVFVHHLVWTNGGHIWLPGAFIVVDGFFVMSGFLIGTLILRELDRSGSFRYLRFVGRRMLRLYPTLLAALAIMAAYSLLSAHRSWAATWPSIRNTALYTFNRMFGFHDINPLSPDPIHPLVEYNHFWSLSTEFQAYLIMPVLLWVSWRMKRSLAVAAVSTMVVMAVVWWNRVRIWHDIGFPASYVFTEARLDTILLGVLVAIAFYGGWITDRWLPALRVSGIVSIAVLFFILFTHSPHSTLSYAVVLPISALSNAVLMVWVILDAKSVLTRFLQTRFLVGMGERTYPGYLIHMVMIMWIVTEFPTWPAWVRIVSSALAAAAVTEVLHRLVERPFMAIRPGSRSKASSTPTKPS